MVQQKSINEQELQLQKNELARYTKLHDKGVVSDQEYEGKKMAFLQAEKNYKNLLSSISQLQSSLIDNTKAIKGNEVNDVKETVNLDRNLSQSFYQLKKAIKDLEKGLLPNSFFLEDFWKGVKDVENWIDTDDDEEVFIYKDIQFPNNN